MTEIELRDKHIQICELLSQRKLKPAFNLIDQFISTNGLGEYRDDFVTLEQNYRFMLKYTVEGIKDPERQKVYEHLLVTAFELVDQCYEAMRMKVSQSIEYQKKRGFSRSFIDDFDHFGELLDKHYLDRELQSLEQKNISLTPLRRTEIEVHFQKIVVLSYHLWFTNQLSDAEIKFVKDFLTNHLVPVHEKSMVITALTLSTIRFFDERKIELLFNSFDLEEPEISQRALIGLLITLYLFDSRMPFFPAITGRLQLLIEDSRFKSSLEVAVLQLIKSKETEKIQRKLQDEIIPEMMKLSPNLRNKLNLETLLTESLSEDKNPEWQEILNETPGLMGKMEELTEMQQEGADVFMSSFAALKHFPFFSEILNWFYPFTEDHPEVIRNPIDKESEHDNSFVRLLMKSSMLCNSDKYSFFFSLVNIPPEYKKMVTESLKAESDQLAEMIEDDSFLGINKKVEIVTIQYLRDLYRFFKIHPQHDGFIDVFALKFDFHNTHAFSRLLAEDLKIIRNIAEFNFAKNYFEEAADLFKLLLNNREEAELIQKLAFCYQKQGDYKSALEYYLKADLFEQNKLWNYKKIALCYRNLKRPAKALDYYLQADLIEPDNLSNLASIGQCQMALKRYEDALKTFFKVEYLSPGNKNIWRPIGWCSFLTGKLDQALSYYEKLIASTPNKYDLMNIGHVYWALGDRKGALDFYKQSIVHLENSELEFMTAFNEDLDHLLDQGVDPDDIPIMLDQLRYCLEE